MEDTLTDRERETLRALIYLGYSKLTGNEPVEVLRKELDRLMRDFGSLR